MEYEKDFVKSFAHRTLSNLEKILESMQGKDGVATYEVTQLINSMLGLLVFPKEEGNGKNINCIDKDFPTKKIERLFRKSIKNERQFIQDEEDAKNQFWQFLRRIRNAIAHEEIEPVNEDGTLYPPKDNGEKDMKGNSKKGNSKIAGFVFGDNEDRFKIYLTNKQICDVLLHICKKILSDDTDATERIKNIRKLFQKSQEDR